MTSSESKCHKRSPSRQFFRKHLGFKKKKKKKFIYKLLVYRITSVMASKNYINNTINL